MARQPNRFRLLATVLTLLGLGLLLTGCFTDLQPTPDWQMATVIYDRNGGERYRLHAEKDQQPVKLAQVPPAVRGAFLAIEDPRFYHHGAFDLWAIARAVVNDGLRAVHLRHSNLQGASTITQQLARVTWLGQEQTWRRKLDEAALSVWLETVHKKDTILELYLNQVYFGNGAYGIERASQLYFRKPTSQLGLAEGALLAGLINGPAIYDPYRHPDAAIARRNLVLDAMARTKAISAEAAAQAKAEKLVVQPPLAEAAGDAFVDYILDILTNPDLARSYGMPGLDVAALPHAGLKVYTTEDPQLQALATKTVANRMAAADAEYGLKGNKVTPEAAAVLLAPKSGQVLALVGGRTRTGLRQFNRAVDARRQPGSAFKPFSVYVPAIAAGLGPATVLDDAPVSLTPDRRSVWPENYDHHYAGLVSMRYGIEQSLNPVAVRAQRLAGGPAVGLEFARRFGFAGLAPTDAGEALALGGLTHGVTPLEMASAFGTLSNLGVRNSPVLITRIEDASGRVIYSAQPQQQPVVSPTISYQMVDILKGVIQRGTAYGFTGGFHGWAAAGKTGTTDDNVDAWFAGFTQDLVTVVWTGYDAPKPLPWTGAFVPVQIWNAIMNGAVTAPPPDWAPPADLVSERVCRRTGLLPNNLCPPDQVVSELFQRQHVPTDSGNLLVPATVVRGPNGGWLLWQPGCWGWPEQHVFIRRPEPYLRHPTAPNDPRYVPADAGEEVPTQTCQPYVPPVPPDGWDWLQKWLQRFGR